MIRTLEQEMAEKVYEKVTLVERKHLKGSTKRNQYGAMAHSLPILIRTAGLAEALAFVHSRDKSHGSVMLLEDLGQVVAEKNAGDFAGQSRAAGLQEYMYLTQRALQALKWFKRFAQSVLDVSATQEDGGSG
jgi:CRISPR-associated protein Cmr5